jgi:hypothetical protein
MSTGGRICGSVQDSTNLDENEGEIHFVTFLWREPSLRYWLRVLFENIRRRFYKDDLFLRAGVGGNIKAWERVYNAK